MGHRPRTTRQSDSTTTVHLVARTHDDTNQLTTLCGLVIDGQHSGSGTPCGSCSASWTHLAADAITAGFPAAIVIPA